MDKVSEIQVNVLTARHIARLLTKLEAEWDVPYWVKQEAKKEFWLLNQNLKKLLWENEAIILDDKSKPWRPEKSK